MKGSITVNGESRPWSDQSIADILAELGIAPERGGVAAALNGTVVLRAEWDETRVKPDDRIEIVEVIRGG